MLQWALDTPRTQNLLTSTTTKQKSNYKVPSAALATLSAQRGCTLPVHLRRWTRVTTWLFVGWNVRCCWIHELPTWLKRTGAQAKQVDSFVGSTLSLKKFTCCLQSRSKCNFHSTAFSNQVWLQSLQMCLLLSRDTLRRYICIVSSGYHGKFKAIATIRLCSLSSSTFTPFCGGQEAEWKRTSGPMARSSNFSLLWKPNSFQCRARTFA